MPTGCEKRLLHARNIMQRGFYNLFFSSEINPCNAIFINEIVDEPISKILKIELFIVL